jgi:hypothetical protein
MKTPAVMATSPVNGYAKCTITRRWSIINAEKRLDKIACVMMFCAPTNRGTTTESDMPMRRMTQTRTDKARLTVVVRRARDLTTSFSQESCVWTSGLDSFRLVNAINKLCKATVVLSLIPLRPCKSHSSSITDQCFIWRMRAKANIDFGHLFEPVSMPSSRRLPCRTPKPDHLSPVAVDKGGLRYGAPCQRAQPALTHSHSARAQKGTFSFCTNGGHSHFALTPPPPGLTASLMAHNVQPATTALAISTEFRTSPRPPGQLLLV